LSADFFSFALPLTDDEANALLARLDGSEVEYNGNVYCDVGFDEFAALVTPDTPMSMCPNFPAFVALDRFACDHVILGGKAHRWIPAAEVGRFRSRLDAAMASGRVDQAIAMVDRGGNAAGDIQAGLTALRAGAGEASRNGLGLLLACLPM